MHYFPAVLARGFLSRALADCGDFTQALVHGEDACRIAEALGHVRDLCTALWQLGYPHGLKGEFSQAIDLLESGLGSNGVSRCRASPTVTVQRSRRATALSWREPCGGRPVPAARFFA
jgi:hypothetical protein